MRMLSLLLCATLVAAANGQERRESFPASKDAARGAQQAMPDARRAELNRKPSAAGSKATYTPPRTTFHIGNSLTWDTRPDFLPEMAALKGHEHTVGWHIWCNKTITDIVSNPAGTCVNPSGFGTWNTALAEHTFDAITIQPFPDGNVSIDDEINAVRAIVASHGSPLIVYVYHSWGRTWQLDSLLSSPLPQSGDAVIRPDAATVDVFTYKLAEALGSSAEVRQIPIARVWYAINQAILDGEIDDLTLSDLYRDSIHASYPIGRYIANASTFSAIYQEHPGGLEKVWEDLSPGHEAIAALPTKTIESINDIIFEVICDDPRSRGLSLGGAYSCNAADMTSEDQYLWGFSDGKITPEDLERYLYARLNGIEAPSGHEFAALFNAGCP